MSTLAFSVARARVPLAIAAVMLAVAMGTTLAGCRHSHVGGTVSTDEVLAALKEGGFDVGGVKNVEPENWSADHCVSGQVAAVELLICEYETDAALAQGEGKVQHEWDSVNVETGVVLRQRRTMLALADRDKKDIGGRAIARMLNAFRALP